MPGCVSVRLVLVAALAAVACAAGGEGNGATCEADGTCGGGGGGGAEEKKKKNPYASAWDDASALSDEVRLLLEENEGGALRPDPVEWRLLAGKDGASLAEFASEAWQRRVAVFKGVPTASSSFLRASSLGAILDATGSAFVDAGEDDGGEAAPMGERDAKIVKRVVRDGEYWTGEHPPPDGGPVNSKFVAAAMGRGYSLILNRLNFRYPPAGRLAIAVADALFGAVVNLNVYYTPPGAQAFEAHYDWMESFVLQVSGKKLWRVYGAPIVAPRPDQKQRPPKEAVDRENPASGVREILLEEGDAMYLPAGVAHEAVADREAPSMHVTVGVELGLVHSWHGLLSAVAAAQEEAAGGGRVPEAPFTWDGVVQLSLAYAASHPDDFSLRLTVPVLEWRAWWASRDDAPDADAVPLSAPVAEAFRARARRLAASCTVRGALDYLRTEVAPKVAEGGEPAAAITAGLGAGILSKLVPMLRSGAHKAPEYMRHPRVLEGLRERLTRLAGASDAEIARAAAGLVEVARSSVAKHMERQIKHLERHEARYATK